MTQDSRIATFDSHEDDESERFVLCQDITLILQPYGAAIWKDSVGDFAVTNHTGRLILEACARCGTLSDIVENVISQIDTKINKEVIRSDVNEFLSSSENMGHVYRCIRDHPTAGTVIGSLDSLSLVRADLSITERCNLHCDYCYVRAPGHTNELSTLEWQKIITKLQNAGAKKFIITGGEPFARKDMLDLLRYVNDLGISITLLTNGTLINHTLALELAKLEHLCEVKVSLDSLTRADTHDRLRGRGSWKRAINGAELLYEQGCTVVVNMTAQPYNCSELYPGVKECAKRGWLMEVSPVVLEGRAQKEHLLATNVRLQYQQQYHQALLDYPQTLRVEQAEITPEWEVSFRCAMLFGTIGVSPDGRLKPCLRSESFFQSLHPMFGKTPSILELDKINIENISFFGCIQQARSSFVPQPSECGECEFLHGTCNGCVIAKYFMEKAGCCPRKEMICEETAAR